MPEQTPEFVGQIRLVLTDTNEVNKYTLGEVLLVGIAVGSGYYLMKRTYRSISRRIKRHNNAKF
jgi:hypothetical protein